MRDWKRWTAVLLAGSLAFTAADDMKLIVQAYEMQNAAFRGMSAAECIGVF